MTFEADLKTVLATVCTRTFPDFAPVNTTRPYATFQQIGGDVINPLDNSAPGLRSAYMQVNVWSATRAEAIALSRAIENAMRAATTFQAKPMAAASADFDADVPVYGASQDFECWHTS